LAGFSRASGKSWLEGPLHLLDGYTRWPLVW
jgi:hypothetical protein